jgi:hypothetical protein
MTTKDMIQAEIDDLSAEDLQALYELIRQFAQARRQAKQQTLMARLKSIAIDAPADLAADHDLYATGVKRVQPSSG